MVAESIKTRLDATAPKVSVRRYGEVSFASGPSSPPLEPLTPINPGQTFNYPSDKHVAVWAVLSLSIKNEGEEDVEIDFHPPLFESWEQGQFQSVGTRLHLPPGKPFFGSILVGATVENFVSMSQLPRAGGDDDPVVYASAQWHIPSRYNTGVVQLQRFELQTSLLHPSQQEGVWSLQISRLGEEIEDGLKQKPIVRTYILDGDKGSELPDAPMYEIGTSSK